MACNIIVHLVVVEHHLPVAHDNDGVFRRTDAPARGRPRWGGWKSNGRKGANCNSVEPEAPACNLGRKPVLKIDSTHDHF
eukprot:2354749-Lingulodinium_polyedra.AAC.1